MTNLLDGIISYLKMDTTGALMVSGEWGCGKTYHIENEVIPALKNNKYNPIKVSLFGIESVNEIPLRIAENYKPSKIEKNKKFAWLNRNKSTVVAKGAQWISSIKWLENFVDVKTLVNNHSGLILNLIPTEKTVIFLDDIERVIDSIDIHLLLGAINSLVEQREYKVIVIANNSHIQKQGAEKLVFKEKVIEKTLIYKPDVLAIFKKLCNDNKYTAPFREFMNKPEVLEVIDPSFLSYKDDRGMLVNLLNIRIIKYAIAHFNKIFESCVSFIKREDNNIADSFLLSLWACTVGLSIECKKNRLTYGDREQFVRFVDLLMPILDVSNENEVGEDLFDDNDNQDVQSEKQRRQFAYNRVEHIFIKVVKTHDLPQIVSPQLFDFIIAGTKLDTNGLKTIWENYKAEVKRNTTDPAYALLQRVMLSQLEMSNDEMVAALKQLLKYVEEGAFSDNVAYVNSATYLLHFSQLIGVDQAYVEKAIKTGIDKMYANVTSLNILDKTNIEVLSGQVPEISYWVIEYEKSKMDEVSESCLKADIDDVCSQFNEDLPALVRRMTIQYGQTKTPDFIDYPILKHIPEAAIIQKVNTIQPKDVMALVHLLKSRFQETVFEKVYVEEISFVRMLESAIEKRKSKKKEYADYLIEEQLMPVIKKIR